jgi:DDE superfamily endonuclease
MKKAAMLDLYSDYLLSVSGLTSATGLSAVSGNAVSHDAVTNFLSYNQYSAKDLWLAVKAFVRSIENADGVLIVDDTIQEKPYTDENAIVCWHFDHSKGRSVKGVNLLSLMAGYDGVAVPVSYEVVRKDEKYTDAKDGKEKRRSKKTKNAMFLEMFDASIANQVKFGYVLADSWFSSAENMAHIKQGKHKDFIFALKDNRTVALSLADKLSGKFRPLSSLELAENTATQVHIKGLEFPVLVTKRIFINVDNSEGILYLATSDLELDGATIAEIYQKRWKIEEYHKSLKQNAALAKSPAKTVRTQANHIFASLYAFCKLQVISGKQKLNHFAIRARMLLEANKKAFHELRNVKLGCFILSTP